MNPPPVEEAAIPEETVIETTVVTEIIETIPETVVETPSEDVVVGVPNVGSIPLQVPSTNFRFVQESEIDSEPVAFESDVEWVEKGEIPAHESIPVQSTHIVGELHSSEVLARSGVTATAGCIYVITMVISTT